MGRRLDPRTQSRVRVAVGRVKLHDLLLAGRAGSRLGPPAAKNSKELFTNPNKIAQESGGNPIEKKILENGQGLRSLVTEYTR